MSRKSTTAGCGWWLDIVLSPDDLKSLDRAFTPPKRKVPLEMI